MLSYELTDPGKINAAYLGNKFTQLTVATALGAGLGWIGSVMSSQLRSNYKVLANCPNSLNPLRYKIVQPIVNPKSARLMSSLADSTGGGILNHAGGELLTAGGKRIELPATASLTVQEALDWQHAMSEGLESMLNRDASLYEHARQALQLKNDLTAIARNAMDDANAAAQLSMIMPERTFEEMRFARTKGYAGNTMYRQMIADASEELRAVRSVTEPGGCFVAGTLVHTRDGLKRIEDIRVGDWVLSQPEETGERAYKRVINTFRFEDKEVWSITVLPKAELVKAHAEKRFIDRTLESRLVVTANHPFWVKGIGWTRADHLEDITFVVGEYPELQMSDGETAVVVLAQPILRTRIKDVGWIQRLGKSERGDFLDLRGGASGEFDFRPEDDLGTLNEGVNWLARDNELRCAVFNFEVEDFNTYYAGTIGVWVHNIGCDANTGGLKAYSQAGIVSPTTPGLYVLESEVKILAGPNRGVILVLEEVTNPNAFWVKFQRETEGVQLRGDDFVSFAYRYDNPEGVNFIKAGDGRAKMSDGSWSMTTIDSKAWAQFYKRVRDEPTVQRSFIDYLNKLGRALEQNPGYTHVLEFLNQEGRDAIAEVIKRRGADLSDAVLSKLCIAARETPGKLSDNLIGFKRVRSPVTGELTVETVNVRKSDILVTAQHGPSPERDIANLFNDGELSHYLEVVSEGASDRNLASAELAEVEGVFTQAKQYWLNQGALASVVEQASWSVSDLPGRAVAQTLVH